MRIARDMSEIGADNCHQRSLTETALFPARFLEKTFRAFFGSTGWISRDDWASWT